LRRGKLGTVIAVGPLLKEALIATQALDVTLLYYTTLAPFDSQTLRQNCSSGNIAVVEPFYQGTLAQDVMAALADQRIRLMSLGVPRRFLTNYGKAIEHDEAVGLSTLEIEERLRGFLIAAN